jgi:tetratricopeptide (TPR) repeat protein
MRIWIARYPAVLAALLGPLVALLFLLTPASAQSALNPVLDNLFAQLRLAPDEASAKAIGQQIWTQWMTPPDPALAARMQQAVRKLAIDPAGALGEFEAIVKDYPDYAEGWNQLATAHYLQGDYTTSLSDIDKVLALEPRHFGALSGRAMIYLKQGKRALALKDMSAASALHPFLAERALFPELLQGVTHI